MRDDTRFYAYQLLSQVLQRHHSLEDALNLLPGGEPRDRAAAHRIAAAVLRRLASIDAVLEPFLRRAPPDEVRQILRIGAAGLLLLDTPAHAAVGTAVELAHSQKLDPYAGLVNAVLRRVAANGPAALAELDGPRLDTPAWLWQAYGENARAIAECEAEEAPIDITRKPGVAPLPEGELLPTGSLRFAAGTRVVDLPGFAEGEFWVQDAAAALPAMLLNVAPGELVADLCAAPGGKTAQLVAAGGKVTAVEKSADRARRLSENLARLGMKPQMVIADVLDFRPEHKFDAILLDAPCSATGTVRRHPDVKHLKKQRDIAGITKVQDQLIDAALAMLRPGGRLVYAVCSMLPQEGTERIVAAQKRGARLEPFTASELTLLPEALSPEGHLVTHPGLWAARGGMDGFFSARLVK